MCGIVGSFSTRLDGWDESRVRGGLNRLAHRGPDDEGLESFRLESGWVVLGQNRLSIIDLTDQAHQPMHSADGRWVLVFNGEIYNYRELRAELESMGRVFHSRSDTEVLLQAWEEWGEAALLRMVGMFAFVVLDRRTAKLHAARDAFGIKPFYYCSDAQGLSFASELPALRVMVADAGELDWQVAYDYLVHGSDHAGERSYFKNLRSLPPGHRFCYDTRTHELNVQAWWQPSVLPVQRISRDDAAQELRRLLLESVRLHLRSDVPIGAALSGGLDSSAIVGCMRHLEPEVPIHTFSFIATGSAMSEEHWVDRVNSHVGAIAHKVQIAPQELAADLDDLMDSQGEPFGSTSIYAQYRVYQLARECGVTVTLDGQGADELCGGYVGYPGPRVRSLLDEGRWWDCVGFLRSWGKWPGRVPMDGLKAGVAEYVSDEGYQLLRRLNGAQAIPAWIDGGALSDAGVAARFPRLRRSEASPGRHMCAELARSVQGLGLQGLLRYGDRNSMRFSIESRLPFLTMGLANFLLTLPEEYLVPLNGETKHVLRKAMDGLVPDEVLARRDKIGFATPEQSWLMQMAPQVRDWLRLPLGLPFFRQNEMLEEFDQVVAGRRPFSWQVWRWINFTRWYSRQFLK